MRISVAHLAIAAAAGILAIFLIAGIDHDRNKQATELRIAIFGDIIGGRSTGPLHSKQAQFVCLDLGDAFRAPYDPIRDPSGTMSGAIKEHLIEQWRCTYSDEKDGFDMTAEGRERFSTPSGTIDLWANDH